ncbi:DUF4350 domain-containing protein [Maribacter polysiphoniae]|uniref:DUF4350 domain-containing protein n=1 Tax=Maribacter polysiphoniae TaxID=429344 RepID=A0A316E5M9_9FLAO|nr:DUF4350 domain-containing protein [Maribacter polysiphoniae]MBD1260859.1 DUF4350 domain-containing protein [Maribacter polysiphoniae]PWK24003.1 uncharacterized protein DUF4350 [Maribacter polysiphoniae]
MRKKGSIYLIIGVVTLVILMLFQYSKPKEINWFPSFVAQHKIPYGTYVLNDLMENKYKDNLKQITQPPFEALQSADSLRGTYVFVNNDVLFGKAELNSLLDWTSKGNTLFIASGSFDEQLQDTLNFKTSALYADFGETPKQVHQLLNPNLKSNATYTFSKDDYAIYFSNIDTLNTTLIGQVDYPVEDGSDMQKHFNVIQQNFGKGTILLSAFPNAFTNYFILKDDNRDYTAGLLSYIDGDRPIYMDNHHKSGKSFYTSPMYIFLNNKELKWAYYIVLIGAMVYVIFEGKRKQRAIPVIVPLKNQTLAFTRTIADMYFEKGEQKSITEHKIAYFLEYIRSHFYMDTIKQDDAFYRNLAARSNHSYEEVKDLLQYMEKLKKSSVITNADLIQLNTEIEKFKVKAHGK